MAPEPGITFPTRRFVVTQTVAGIETNLIVSTPLPNNYTTDQVERLSALSQAKQAKLQDPNIIYRIYGPTNGGNHTDGDCIWDSRVSD